MAKKDTSVWFIFFEGIKIYALNIHKFLLYMSFPVLGQLLGLSLIFGLTDWFAKNINQLSVKYPALNEMSVMFSAVIILVIPGLIIFLKAFWDYLVAFVALNSMAEGYLNTGKVYDFKAHKAIVSKKTFSFVVIWLLISIFTIIGIIPVFWLFVPVLFVYFILVFQVFTFENGLSPVGYFKRSLSLVKGKFGRTFLLMALLVLFTYHLLVLGMEVVFDAVNLTEVLSKSFEAWAYTLPLESLNVYNLNITPQFVASNMVKQLATFIVIGYSLPIRSICWTLWYNNLVDETVQQKPKKKKSVSKKTEPKTFKIEKRQIDPEIIRRARLEDDEY